METLTRHSPGSNPGPSTMIEYNNLSIEEFDEATIRCIMLDWCNKERWRNFTESYFVSIITDQMYNECKLHVKDVNYTPGELEADCAKIIDKLWNYAIDVIRKVLADLVEEKILIKLLKLNGPVTYRYGKI